MMLLGLIALGVGRLEEMRLGQALIEPLVVALLLGVVLRNAIPALADRLQPGANLAAKQVLEVGVAVLGASVFFPEILKAGPALLALVVIGVSAGIGVSFLIGRALGLEPKLAVLVAVGNSICGNSAIAAVAPVIRADKRQVASAIGLTAVIGVCLVLGLPLLIAPLGLSNYQYGVLAGMSVYAVPQVLAAAFPVSQLSGEVATLVKLCRVLLLGPVVVAMGLLFRGGAAKRSIKNYLPWFVIGFSGLAVLRSVGIVPDDLSARAADLSRLLTLLAMGGLGYGVELIGLKKVGPVVAVAVFASLAFMASFSIVLIHLLAINGG
jgi:uncharacterized integral membrane protein (TIGR00698 family)